MNTLKNIDRLHPAVAKVIRPYLNDFLNLYRDSIVSIYIYGSAAGQDFIPKSSDVNSLMVFKKIEFPLLKSALVLIRRGIRKKICAPLFLTLQWTKSSMDVFPLEFLDIKNRNMLVYGEDFFKLLEIGYANIRFVCEERLKGAVLRIRQSYLEVGLHRKDTETLMKDSLNSLLPVFRGLLRLRGVIAHGRQQDMLEALGNIFGIDTSIFSSILKDRRNDNKIGGEEIETVFRTYLERLQDLSDIADKL